jgi:hypothetical protein
MPGYTMGVIGFGSCWALTVPECIEKVLRMTNKGENIRPMAS